MSLPLTPVTSWARNDVWHRIQVDVQWYICLVSPPMHSRGLNEYCSAVWARGCAYRAIRYSIPTSHWCALAMVQLTSLGRECVRTAQVYISYMILFQPLSFLSLAQCKLLFRSSQRIYSVYQTQVHDCLSYHWIGEERTLQASGALS